jgi:hypothetical protein
VFVARLAAATSMKKNEPAESQAMDPGRAIDKPFSSRKGRGMRMTRAFSLLMLVSACGSQEVSPPRSAADADAADADTMPAETVEVASPSLLPDCNPEAEDCMPPARWVDRLCSGVHPEVALHMFRGGSPWKRMYSRHRAPAYNGAGDRSLSDERVEKGEELIALRRNDDTALGEMSVGETAGYDFLRWNGSCVTLQDGEYSTKPPRRRQHARVEWKWLGDAVLSALTNDGTVKEAYVARRKECKGATLGRVTKKCVERESSLVTAIVDYVRSGGPLPQPSERL